MNPATTRYPRMNDQESAVDPRQRYEDALVRAMRFAERVLPRDQALEIAHDVASEMLRLPENRVTGTLIYIAVTSRLRMHWRSTERRTAMEGAYHAVWSSVTRLWADPGAQVELDELLDRIAAAVADMPPRMREIFLLVRGEELSYKEVASRLGVAVGTVHTQFSRATVLLRECVARYHADAPRANQSRRGRVP